MLRGVLVLLGCQLLGELFVVVTGIPVPGPVIGMLLLTLALVVAGRAVPAWLKTVSDGLLSHLALLFVPAGVGLMVHFELLSREWLVMIVTLVISTGLTMAVTGWVFQKIMRSRGGEHD